MRQEPTGIKTLTELSITTLARTIKRCSLVYLFTFDFDPDLCLKIKPSFMTCSRRCCFPTLFNILKLLYTSRVSTLDGLPEELALELLERVLSLGLLTPKVLEMFERLGHTEVDIRIAELNIQELPLLVPTTRNRWLGY